MIWKRTPGGSIVILTFSASGAAAAKWAGVDETVVEHYAEAAGRPPRAPVINTDQGDLLLFFFLLAGALGGFVAGYSYRMLCEKKLGEKTS